MNTDKYIQFLKLFVTTVLYILPVCVLASLVFVFLRWLIRKTGETKTEGKTNQQPKEQKKPARYQSRKFLTEAEMRAYERLKQYANYNFLFVYPKVSLTSIMKAVDGTDFATNQKQLSNRLVDFVVFDQSMNVKAIIELKGYDPQRANIDMVKEQLLKEMGYKIIYTTSITQETLKQI